jgi:hypothetical protein
MRLTVRLGAILAGLILAAGGPAMAQAGALESAPRSDAEFVAGLFASGDFVRASDRFAEPLRREWTPEKLAAWWSDITARLGQCTSQDAKAVELDGIEWRIHVVCRFERGYADLVLTFPTVGDPSRVLAFAVAYEGATPPRSY